MMPRFFLDMPPRRRGLYEASATVHGRFGWRRKVMRVRGQRRAYVVARVMALMLDLSIPAEVSVPITWEVRRLAPTVIEAAEDPRND